MQIKLYKTICLFLSLWILGCGSGYKLAKNPQPLGFVPFANRNMAGPTEDLNKQMELALRSSGSFFVHKLDTMPDVWDLQEMKAVDDALVQWIVTGEFVYESIDENKGKKIPFVVYTPNVIMSAKLRYRLFSKEKDGWQDINEISAEQKKGGDLQFIEYDASDPSLALDAKDRQLMRQRTYQKLANKLIERIEKQLKIKK